MAKKHKVKVKKPYVCVGGRIEIDGGPVLQTRWIRAQDVAKQHEVEPHDCFFAVDERHLEKLEIPSGCKILRPKE